MNTAHKIRSASPLAQELLKDLKPRAKSLIVTVFGDAILPYGGEAWLGDLITLMAVFDIGDRLVRTSVFRLSQEGILTARQVGRRSIYALTEAGRREFDAAQRKIYAPLAARQDLDRDVPWTIVLLSGAVDSAAREALRQELGWSGFGTLGTQVLIGSGSDRQRALATLRTLQLEDRAVLFEATARSAPGSLRELCHEAWGLAETDRGYRAFIDEFSPVLATLLGEKEAPSPEDAFVLRTLMIHAYRRTLLKDPGLPPALMPDDSSGRAARHLAAEIYGNLRFIAQDFLEATLKGTEGELSPLSDQFSARFVRAIPD